MKSWRPNNWNNPYHKSGDFGEGKLSWNEYPEFQAYEEGASAILEVLFQLAKESPTKTYTIDSRVVNIFEGKQIKESE